MLSLQSKVTIPERVLFRELNGEAVILNLDSGKYFGLDEIGTRIWTLLGEHGNLADVYRILLAEYDVQAHCLEKDLMQLVDDLVSFGLIQIIDEP